MDPQYNILSLDGGGSWALLQLLTLKERYPGKNGHEILREFDLIIANSGGSIVLAALASAWELERCIEIFNNEEKRKKIFSKNSFWKRYFPTGITRWFGVGPKYSTTEKYKSFREIFKEIESISLEELPEYIRKSSLKIIVCTFDSLNNKAKFFKSYRRPDKIFDSVNLVKAIQGSTNAPLNYFDFPARFKADESNRYFYLWDGALGGFNNPVVAGLIEAIEDGIHKENIKIVSLGTGNKVMSSEDKETFFNLYLSVLKHRKLNVIKGLRFFGKIVMNMAKTILYEPPDWANYVAYVLRFDNDLMNHEVNIKSFIRLSPLIHIHNNLSEDDKKLVQDLYNLDMDLIKQEKIDLIYKCFERWKAGAIKNQPIRGHLVNKNDIVTAIGHDTFEEAMKDW